MQISSAIQPSPDGLAQPLRKSGNDAYLLRLLDEPPGLTAPASQATALAR
jgi:hypothetical protein